MKKLAGLLAVLALAGVMYGCGGGSSDSNSNGNGSPGAITGLDLPAQVPVVTPNN